MKQIRALFLILLLTMILPLASCQIAPQSNGGKDDFKLNYRIADKTEGTELLMSNDAYHDGMTQNDLDFRMQARGSSLEDYMAFAKEQVLDFTDEQKTIIHKHMERISKVVAERGYKIPELEQIVFINTTMLEEGGPTAYTHGTQIYFNGNVLTKYDRKDRGDEYLDFGTTALVPVDGTNIYYTPEQAENFDEVFGKNTDYVIDPEECMADNFGFLLAYGMNGRDGSGYPDPEIIRSVEDILKK